MAPAWSEDELQQVGEAEELDLASVRSNGSRRKPVITWAVARAATLKLVPS